MAKGGGAPARDGPRALTPESTQETMHESTGGSSNVTTQERLADLLVSKYGVERGALVPEAPMAALGLDSLSLAELMFDIEDAFGITLKQEGTELQTFGDAVRLIDAARAGHSEPAG